MKEGSLVEWTGEFMGQPKKWNEGASPLVLGEVYTVVSLHRGKGNNTNKIFDWAILAEKGANIGYNTLILKELQPPGEVDIEALLEESVLI